MIKIDTIQDLRNIDIAVREVIEKYLRDNDKTPSGFAKEVGIHPLQMLRYINLKKNMRFDTLIEIGRKAK
tara:strand:+ start:119 stop:328 length:210 start_codon:yes stop_codon:yes gene_type:complete